MDLKKILALAMIALVALPSLTMAVADYDGGAGPAGAIERARIYLDKVMTSVEKTASEYPDDENMQGYLNEIYALLGRYEYERPEFLLESGTYGIAELSEVESYGGNYSVHLKTTGTPGDGDEARIVIPMPEGFTLGDIETISWWTFLVSGYIPHVDIFTEVETLVAEGAHVNNNLITGWATGTWFNTFEGATGVYTPERGITGSTTLLTTVNSETAVWYSSGNAMSLHTLGEFQTPTLVDGMNRSTLVTKIEIEVDNWIPADWSGVNAEAYVDDIKIDGAIYDFEEREAEDGKAKYYLDQASASLVEGDIRSAARSLASARNIVGRVNGLLKSMTKAHKVTRTEKFNRRIQGIKDKIERQKGPKNK